MKTVILTFTLLAALATSVNSVGSKEDISVTEDKEFKQFMDDFNNTLTKNKQVQVKADEAQVNIVETTVHKMTEMKKEMTILKTELNEVKIKLDSVGIDTNSYYELRPISHYKKD